MNRRTHRRTDRRTDRRTERRTFRLIESLGPEGQCFEIQLTPPPCQKKEKKKERKNPIRQWFRFFLNKVVSYEKFKFSWKMHFDHFLLCQKPHCTINHSHLLQTPNVLPFLPSSPPIPSFCSSPCPTLALETHLKLGDLLYIMYNIYSSKE